MRLSSSTAFGRVLRSLRRSPGFVAIATLSMGVALGISTSVFAVMDAMTHPTPPFRDVERLYSLEFFVRIAAPPPIDSLVANLRRLEGIERVDSWRGGGEGAMAVINGRVAPVEFATVSPATFEVLGVRPRIGRLLTAADFESRNVAVVSDMLWRRDFANRWRIGDATIQMGDASYRIVGVLPSGTDRSIRADVFIPAAPGEQLPSQLVRLKPGVTMTEFQPRLRTMNERLTREYAGPKDRGIGAFIRTLQPDPLAMRDFHRAMIGAAICILLIACANVAALMLARGLSKRRDYALRLALGAQPAELGREVILEIAILAVAGCVAGMLVTSWFVGLIGRAMPPEMEWQGFVQPQWSWRVLAMSMTAVLVSIAVAGGFPAWIAARTDPSGPLKEGAASTTGRTQTKFRWLVIAELAIAMTLLMSTSLMQKSVRLMQRYDFGYPVERLMQVGVGAPWRQDSTTVEEAGRRKQQALETLRGIPGVEAVMLGGVGVCNYRVTGMVSDRAAQGGTGASFTSAGNRGGGCRAVGPRFFETYGLRMVAGRDFADGDLQGTGVAVLDERTARMLFGNEDPLGRSVKLGDLNSANPWLPIVGVVRNHRLNFDMHPELGEDSVATMYMVGNPGEVYRNRAGQPRGSLNLSYVVRVSGDRDKAQLAILNALAPLTPSTGRSYAMPLNQHFDRQLKVEKFLGLIFTLLGLASLLLGAAGLYSVISYVAGQRMREFAVRIALGATKQNVAKLVMREAFLMAIGGTAVGAGFGMWAAFLLWDRMWGVYPVDAQALIIAESVLILTTMAACLVPALKATRSDPLEVMRAA
jgi:putative ABC transport system permease protein